MLYGVSQLNHGHEYRWIFQKNILSQHIYNGGTVPDEDCIDCGFPIGGGNSSATWLKKLADENAAREFLLAPCEGPDVEDPLLIDIGEYILSVDDEYDSCTSSVITYPVPDQYDRRRDAVVAMAEKLAEFGKDGWENPFHGDYRSMRFSELECIYHNVGTDNHSPEASHA